MTWLLVTFFFSAFADVRLSACLVYWTMFQVRLCCQCPRPLLERDRVRQVQLSPGVSVVIMCLMPLPRRRH